MSDINPSVPFMQSSLAYGLIGRYTLNSRWVGRVNLYKGILAGDDKVAGYLPDRSLEFKSNIWELAGIMEFNFLPYFTGSKKNFWTPYLFGGAALLYHRPKVGNTDLRDKYTEGQNNTAFLNGESRPDYSYYTFSIPFGMGVKYSFSRRIAASLEWGMRKTFTDYIDDISTTYYLPANLSPGDDNYVAQGWSDPNRDHDPLMQRGNAKTNDWYSFFGLTLTYNINLTNRNKCSDFENRYE
ncbi:MAG: DUF6089 family protein [Bacteroidales bacterium]